MTKIDKSYKEKEEDRQRIHELIKKNTALEIEKTKLEARWKSSGVMSGNVEGGSHRVIIDSREGRCFATAPFPF